MKAIIVESRFCTKKLSTLLDKQSAGHIFNFNNEYRAKQTDDYLLSLFGRPQFNPARPPLQTHKGPIALDDSLSDYVDKVIRLSGKDFFFVSVLECPSYYSVWNHIYNSCEVYVLSQFNILDAFLHEKLISSRNKYIDEYEFLNYHLYINSEMAYHKYRCNKYYDIHGLLKELNIYVDYTSLNFDDLSNVRKKFNLNNFFNTRIGKKYA